MAKRVLLASLFLWGQAHADAIQFRDRASEAGLQKVQANVGAWYGAGAAFVDLDGDSWPDIFFGAGIGDHDQLCLNQRDGTFSCRPLQSTPNSADTLSVAAGDFDGNGTLDLYVMRGNAANSLYANDGHAQFTDVTARAGVGGPNGLYATSGTFLDYDHDGKLDLYVGRWFGSEVSQLAEDSVYHNRGDGTFELKDPKIDTQDRSTLALIAFDYDGDGFVDLFRGSDYEEPLLFHNRGDGTFSDVTMLQPPAFRMDVSEGMGADIADFDGDGDFDLFVTNSKRPNWPRGSAFFVNQGNGTFVSSADAYGLLGDFSWGVGFPDLDNDGWPDLFVTTSEPGYHFIYRNNGGTSFTEMHYPSPIQMTENCVTAAFADYDGDGRIDVLLWYPHDQPPALLHNETANSGHWLELTLRGQGPAPDPLGAVVRASAGGRVILRQVLGQSSHGAQNDRRVHLGIGAAPDADVEIDWPSRRVDHVHLAADHAYVFVENEGLQLPPPPPKPHGCQAAPGSPTAPLPLASVGLLLAGLGWKRRRSHVYRS